MKTEKTQKNFKLFKNIFTALACITVLTAAVCLTGCSQWDPPYESLDEQGYTVSVKFDANGGVFANTPSEVYVIDVFNPDEVEKNSDGLCEIPLIAPDNPLREDKAYTISRTGYFFAGWYSERELRTDENGKPLDEYGVPTEKSERKQGYIYSGHWDFENDTLKVDPTKEYTSKESVMTLYAAWIPYCNYNFYSVDADGSVSESPYATLKKLKVELPEWSEKTGKLDMNKFPEIEGKTLDKIYLDSAMTSEVTEDISSGFDAEHGIINVENIDVYTTWKEGKWFKVYTPKHLRDNAIADGNYEILADLDFENDTWPSLFSGGNVAFTGTIIGNGHKISNVTATQANTAQLLGGLFGNIGDGAEISDISFENVTYKITAGSRMRGATFGLLAGSVSDNAELTGISVSGKIVIGNRMIANNEAGYYTVGLLFGNGDTRGIDFTGIDCVNESEESTIIIDTDRTSGSVSLTFGSED